MRLFGKPTARQKEIRRSKAERGLTWRHRLREQLRFQPLTFLLFCAVITAWIVNSGSDVLQYRVGQRVPRDVTSRVTFRVENEQATARLRDQARDNAERYYALDVSLLQDIRGRLDNALRLAREYQADPSRLREKAAEIKLELDDAALAELTRLGGLPDSTDYPEAVARAVRSLRLQPLVEAHELAHRRTGSDAVLVDPDPPAQRPIRSSELLYASNPEHVNRVAEHVIREARFPAPLREALRNSLLAMLRDGDAPDAFRPLYRYDTERSARAAEEAYSRVETQYDFYQAGARLVAAGPISEPGLALLREELRQYRNPDLRLQDEQTLAWLDEARELEYWAHWARGVVAVLLVFGLGGYIIHTHQREAGNFRRRLATGLTLLLVVLLTRVIYLYTPSVHLAVGAYALAITLIAITASGPATYATGGLLALVVAIATRQGLGFVVVLVTVAVLLFLGLRDVRNRGRIIAIGALTALAAGLATQLTGLTDGQSFSFVFWNQTVWALLTTLAAAFIVEGILPGIERLFGVTTSMTLLEWCDPNKPLLRMMAAESPGTYNHSLLVGTLADAAAEAIGANGLRARAGAYYHDIGKTNKPEYFVENQGLGSRNRHARLSPAMSHLIIIGHVKDGIEMAREYGVPAVLRDFIPEHHGTTVVEYFYHAAHKARKPGDPEISDEQFRYPGPKPQSRETAIVMICDGVEGAVRAMSEPTPNRIEDTVDKIIKKRMMDGQFDECDLTFRELHTIRNALVKSLCAIYHGRIVYPAEKEPETPPASAPAQAS